MNFWCRLLGHAFEYTEEYRNSDGHVQADKVCIDCGESEKAWVGPTVEAIEEACNISVPTKEEAYANV